MNHVQKLIAQRRSHEILAERAPIPECDGVSDCYFCAAGDLARMQAETRD